MELSVKPRSKFVKIKCPECENEMIVFNHAKTEVVCEAEGCEQIIATPNSGKATLNGEIVEEFE